MAWNVAISSSLRCSTPYPWAAVVKGEAHRFVVINEAAARLLGRSPE